MLGYPTITGWVAQGGNPCGGGCLGVTCGLGVIIEINLCNNKIGGNIPLSLPPNLEQLLLSGNEINGLIPPSIASLSQIVAITLDHNKLIGIIPEAFQRLPRLTRIDLSYNNNLSGQLPLSMQCLTSLTSLFLQYNSLEGSLAVLEDLPLTDLNIMHNNFHPIPKKFFDIPNFKCSPEEIYSPPTYSPTISGKKENNTRLWLTLGIVGGLVVLLVLIVLFIPRNQRACALVALLRLGGAIIGCGIPSRTSMSR